MKYDLDRLKTLPEHPGVYLMKNAVGQVLYIGKAKILQERIKQYFKAGRDNRAMIPILVTQIHEIETIVTFDEKEALLLENTLIKKHKPKYNVLLKDDKSFISIFMNIKHAWPMVKLVRHTKETKEDGLYFGPYTSALAAREIFDLITRIFPLRECSDNELKKRNRPCILYSMRRCLAPCVRKCSIEEYQEIVTQTKQFLAGKNKEIVASLKKQMDKASENLQFEKAGALLRTIRQIEEVTSSKKSHVQTKLKECDVFTYLRQNSFLLIVKLMFRDHVLIGSEHFDFSLIAESDEEIFPSFLLQHYATEKPPEEIILPHSFPEEGLVEEILSVKCTSDLSSETKKLLDLAHENAKILFDQLRNELFKGEEILLRLQELLTLTRMPIRIECFDTSNLAGKDPVASMVAFTNAMPDKKRYRTYKIAPSFFTDDYAALTEVLTRRLKRAKEEDDLPDLILVDGGKGQLSTAEKVLKELNIASIDLVAIAKEESRHDKGLTKERLFIQGKSESISLDFHSPLLFFLQRIRDEAHRKAISFHRQKLKARTLTSALDEIPGIGPIKKKKLLQAFGSIARIKEATIEELTAIKGISQKDAETLLLHMQ